MDTRAERLARFLAERRSHTDGIPPAPRGPVALSPGQRRLWFLDELLPGSAAYNVPLAAVARAGVERQPFEAALAALLDRQRALRHRVVVVDGQPMQEELADLVVPVQWRDAASHDDARAQADAFARHPFDLAAGPLLRVAVWTWGGPGGESGAGSLICVVAHHLVVDAWSSQVVLGDLAELYRAALAGDTPALPPLPVPYRDVAAWQSARLASGAMDPAVAWWRDRLAGAPATLDLPPDRRPGSPRAWRSGRVVQHVAAQDLAAWQRLAVDHGATLFAVLLAGFDATVVRLGGNEDVVVGSPVAGRVRPEWEGLAGFFVNTVVLRTDCSGDPTFASLLDAAMAGVLAAVAHQEVPFERLVAELAPERDLVHNPLFQAMVTLQNAPTTPVDWGGADLEGVQVDPGAARFDLEAMMWVGPDGGLVVQVDFDVEVFEASTVEGFVQRWLRLLASVVAGGSHQRLSALDIFGPGERAAVLAAGEGVDVGPGPPVSVVSLIERVPAAVVAVVDGDEVLTYGELRKRARGLAGRLVDVGVGPESVVGVCAERSAATVVAWLAVLLAGGAYLPLDPSYPEERLAFMLADAGASVVVAPAPMAGAVTTVHPDERSASAATATAVGPDHLACVIYTSGSTGRPKGIGISHRALSRLVAAPDYVSLGPADVVTFGSSPSFDAATFEVWGTLAAGATLVVVPRETLLSPEELRTLLAERNVTTLFVTTALFNQLAAYDPKLFAGLRQVLFGGEAVDPAAVAAVLGGAPPQRLLHFYGPAEATTFATWFPVEDVPDGALTVPIGRPVVGTVVRVLDSRGQLVAPGGVGDLHVGGPGLARGYLGRPALTAERFVPDPFSPQPGARLYQTGDRVRLRGDGAIEFLGRFDDQVKVRGFRIEPGEVEAALLAHPDVAEAVVVVRPGSQLVGYVVGDVDGAAVRQGLRATLPSFMVPVAVVVLDRIPLNANGKVDRAALPAPQPAAVTTAPRTAAEATLAGVWADVLGHDAVGIHDNFFDVGGDSILSLLVIARAAERGLALTIRDVFAHQTVAELAAVAVAAPVAGRALVEGDEGTYPLTPLQAGMLFHTLDGPDPLAYHERLELVLTGQVDVDALVDAWRVVVARHAACRTRFVWEGRDQPVQVVEPDAEPDVVVATGGSVDGWRADEAEHRFGLDRPPLRLAVLRAAPDTVHVMVSYHHALLDGWSVPVLLDELFTVYGGGGPDTLGPAHSPKEFVDWLAGADHEGAERHWRGVLDGLAGPYRLPGAPGWTGKSGLARAGASIPPDVADRLAAVARRMRVTMSTVVHGIVAALAGSLAGTDDVVLGCVVSGRPPELADVERRVGTFLNTVPLRARLGGDGLADLSELQGATVLQQVHGHVSLARIQEWAGLRPGERLFDVLVAFENVPVADTALVEGLHVSAPPRPPSRTGYPLAFTVFPGHGLEVGVNYDRARVTDEDAAALARRFVHVANQLADEVEPDLLDDGERAAVLAWGSGVPGGELSTSVVSLIERVPASAVAVVDGDEVLTYGELLSRARGLAGRLAEVGVGPESVVGVCADRSADTVVAWLAVWLAGGAYLPLDPSYPADRLAFMLSDSGASAAISATPLPTAITTIHPDERSTYAATTVGPGHLAYVMYTSGSTGQPKGIGVPHRAVTRLVSQPDYVTLGPGDVVAFASSPSFDAATFEVWGALAAGATLAVVPRDTLLSPDLLAAQQVGTMFITTALFNQLAAHDPAVFAGRVVLFGGEAADPAAVAAVVERGGPARLVHVYGPTETTTFATWFDVRAAAPTVPIGRPIAHTTARVLDRRGRLAPPGGVGELHVGGPGVARGYVGRPGLTAERFVPDPFSPEPGARLYRTGDRVRLGHDGEIEFLGRFDDQVKIRGFRIEPGEIEAALLAQPGVAEAVVVVRPGSQLVGYVVGDVDGDVAGAALRQGLRAALPSFMVPSAVMVLDRLPLNANGKVDRDALPGPEVAPARAAAPTTSAQAVLLAIWADVLGHPGLGVDDDFFDLGGDSIKTIQVVAAARAEGLQIRAGAIFRYPTVAELAAHAVVWADDVDAPDAGSVSPTPVQQWFAGLDLPDRHHFNQSVLLALHVDVDVDALAGAVRALVAHHDGLRAASGDLERGRTVDAVQAGFDLEQGPLFRAVLLDAEPDAERLRLLLAAHHLVVDVVSWGILIGHLELAYGQLRAGEQARLPARTTAVGRWADRLGQAARAGRFDGEVGFWVGQAEGAGPLPIDPSGDPTVAAERRVEVTWPAAAAVALTRDLPRLRHVRPDAVLLAATSAALTGWSGCERVLVRMEGHGRADLFPDLDVSRTVGWFTALAPVAFDRPPADPADAVAEARRRLDAIPSSGVGFGALRWLAPDTDAGRALAALPEPMVSYNFLGSVPSVSSALIASAAPEGVPHQYAPSTVRAHALDISLGVLGDQLVVVLAHDGRLAPDAVDDLAARLRHEVDRLIGSLAGTLAGALEGALAEAAPPPSSGRRAAQQSLARQRSRRGRS
jgi:amino acid adenylation domain-containing protein/non-ribosomal peptide synthase protein (TIGR01720 family)